MLGSRPSLMTPPTLTTISAAQRASAAMLSPLREALSMVPVPALAQITRFSHVVGLALLGRTTSLCMFIHVSQGHFLQPRQRLAAQRGLQQVLPRLMPARRLPQSRRLLKPIAPRLPYHPRLRRPHQHQRARPHSPRLRVHNQRVQLFNLRARHLH